MDRWMVYSWLKRGHMETGRIPTAEDTVMRFYDKATVEEITKGLLEFHETERRDCGCN